MGVCCRPYIPKVLPLVYNDALSYYENVCSLIRWVTDLQDEYNKFAEEITNYVDNKIDAEICSLKEEFEQLMEETENQLQLMIKDFEEFKAEIKSEIDENVKRLEAVMDDLIAQMNKEFSELEAEIRHNQSVFESRVDEKINDINNEIVDLKLLINKYESTLNDKFTSEIEKMYTYIDAHISYQIANSLYVTNPMTGETDTLGNVLDMLYNRDTALAITADEYDNMDLTADEYDNLNITAHDYDTIARLIFFDRIHLQWFKDYVDSILNDLNAFKKEVESIIYMYSPFTGNIEPVDMIIRKLSELHMDSYTAQGYDDLELTADDFDNMDESAYWWDWLADKNNSEMSLLEAKVTDLQKRVGNFRQITLTGTGNPSDIIQTNFADLPSDTAIVLLIYGDVFSMAYGAISQDRMNASFSVHNTIVPALMHVYLADGNWHTT